MIDIKVTCPRCDKLSITLACCTQLDGSLHPTTYMEKSKTCACQVTAYERDTICHVEAREVYDKRRVVSEASPTVAGINDTDPLRLVSAIKQTAYAAGASALQASVRAAIFDVLDAGDGNYIGHDGQKHPWGWLFQQTESDGETARRVRFVDAVLARLEELR